MATVFIILAAVGWGMIGLFTRTLGDFGFTSLELSALRAILAALLLFLWIALRDRAQLKIRVRDLWMFFGTGVCSILVFNICYFTAITLTTLSVAAILLYTAPVFVMLLSAIFFHEKITAKKLLALGLALGGCVLVTGILSGAQTVSTAGILWGVGSGIGYALYSIFGRAALARYSPLTVTTYTFLVAGVCALPFSSMPHVVLLCIEKPLAAVWLVLFALIATVLPYVLYTEGLRRTEPGRASVMASLEPVVASIIGIAVFHEPLRWDGLLGMLLVLAAVVLLNLPVGRKSPSGTETDEK